jgi:hypothetical protein
MTVWKQMSPSSRHAYKVLCACCGRYLKWDSQLALDALSRDQRWVLPYPNVDTAVEIAEQKAVEAQNRLLAQAANKRQDLFDYYNQRCGSASYWR